MSFRRLLTRTVSIVPREVTGKDARGNEVWSDGPAVEVAAAREPAELTEDAGDDRDQQSTRWVYFFLPSEAALALTGRDVIVDGNERLEVYGTPDHVERLRTGKVHHVEAIAEVTTASR